MAQAADAVAAKPEKVGAGILFWYASGHGKSHRLACELSMQAEFSDLHCAAMQVLCVQA